MSDINPKPDTPPPFPRVGKPRRGKHPFVTVKLNEAQRALLEQVAFDLGGLSVSDAIRWLIQQVKTGTMNVPNALPTDLQRTG